MRPSFAVGVLLAAIAIPNGFNSPAWGHENGGRSYPYLQRAPSPPQFWLGYSAIHAARVVKLAMGRPGA